MKRFLIFHESGLRADGWLLWLAVLFAALLLALALATTAAAGTAYFSAQGFLFDAGTTQYFDFDVTSTLRAPAPFSLRTWHYGGGVNAAGDTIPAGSFDPILELWGPNSLLIQNDDGPYGLDSLIDWATVGMPSQLATGSYGLRLFPFSGQGDWAVDLVADATKFTLTGAGYYSPTGYSGIWSLKLGSNDVRTPARLDIGGSDKLELYHYYVTGGQLVLGNTGGATAVVSGELETGHSVLGWHSGSVGSMTIGHGQWRDFGNYDATSIGFNGKGILEVQPYGHALFDCNLRVARYPGSEGHLTVSGSSAYVKVFANLEIGVGGAGTMRIDEQGYVDSRLIGNLEDDVVASLAGSTGTVDVVGYNSLWETDTLTVGDGGQGIVRITSGGKIDTYGNAFIGKTSSASASSVTVAGMSPQLTKATWLVSHDLHIAGTASGPSSALFTNLSISTGGSVDVEGTTTVWSPGGSLNLLGGELETGSLIVKPGATFTHHDGTLTVDGGTFDPGVTYYILDGSNQSALPTVRLANGASAVLDGTAYVANYHHGRMEIFSGSHVDLTASSSFSIGLYAGSDGEVVVDGTDTKLIIPAQLAVGTYGRGVFRVRSGGLVQILGQSLNRVAGESGSVGTIEVSGADAYGTPSTYTTHGNLWIGHLGQGALHISRGGYINALQGAAIAPYFSPTGSSATVTDTSSHFDVVGPLYVGGNDTSSGGTAKLTVQNDGLVTAGSVKVWQPGTVELNGGIISTGSFELAGGTLRGTGSLILVSPNALTNAGLVSPGLSAGVINIASGNYVQDAAGTLAIEIGGPDSSQYDHLNIVNGSATLAGRLAVSLIDPTGGTNVFMPSPGNMFDILDWTNRSGTFDALVLPTLATGLMWNASQLYTAGILSVFLAGDYNGDGTVDAADYTVWRNSLGQTGIGLAADGDNTGASAGRIDQADYAVWKSNYGQTAGSGAGATTGLSSSANTGVPEPAGLSLLIIAGALACVQIRIIGRPIDLAHGSLTIGVRL